MFDLAASQAPWSLPTFEERRLSGVASTTEFRLGGVASTAESPTKAYNTAKKRKKSKWP